MPQPEDRQRTPDFLVRCIKNINQQIASLRDKRRIIIEELRQRHVGQEPQPVTAEEFERIVADAGITTIWKQIDALRCEQHDIVEELYEHRIPNISGFPPNPLTQDKEPKHRITHVKERKEHLC